MPPMTAAIPTRVSWDAKSAFQNPKPNDAAATRLTTSPSTNPTTAPSSANATTKYPAPPSNDDTRYQPTASDAR